MLVGIVVGERRESPSDSLALSMANFLDLVAVTIFGQQLQELVGQSGRPLIDIRQNDLRSLVDLADQELCDLQLDYMFVPESNDIPSGARSMPRALDLHPLLDANITLHGVLAPPAGQHLLKQRRPGETGAEPSAATSASAPCVPPPETPPRIRPAHQPVT